MRPVRRGNSPIETDFHKYEDAKKDLIARISRGNMNGKDLGAYCSYCERRISTGLAVEHIQPKGGEYGKSELEFKWTNFLLACVNCNSTKKDKNVNFDNLFLPDRDNTFSAFIYLGDGTVIPSPQLSDLHSTLAKNCLELVGLDKELRESYDSKGSMIAQDRASQRLNVWGTAEDSLEDYRSNLNNEAVMNGIVKSMLGNGFFSIWLTVFENYPEIKNRLIDSISGTRESGCFNDNGEAIYSHPNNDNLGSGGKI